MLSQLKHGMPGFATLTLGAPPEPKEPTVEDLKQRWLERFEAMTASKTSLRRRVLASFRAADEDEDGLLSREQCIGLAASTGAALDPAETARVYAHWASSRADAERISIVDAVNDLLSLPLDGGSPESPGARVVSTKSNRESHPHGVFGGGAFEDEAHRPAEPRHESPALRRAATTSSPSNGHVNKNCSSVEGGIFAEEPQPCASPSRPGKTRSNDPSVPGGIFAVSDEVPVCRPPQQPPPWSASFARDGSYPSEGGL